MASAYHGMMVDGRTSAGDEGQQLVVIQTGLSYHGLPAGSDSLAGPGTRGFGGDPSFGAWSKSLLVSVNDTPTASGETRVISDSRAVAGSLPRCPTAGHVVRV